MDKKRIFSFTRNEKLGFVVLAALLLVFVLAVYIRVMLMPDHTNADFSAFADSVETFEQHIAAENTDQYADNNFISASKKAIHLTPFSFDPNTLPPHKWQEMGFSEKQAAMVDKYRKKGGHFDKKEDVKKLFFIGDEEYNLLEPYIEIPSKSHTPQPQASTTRQEQLTAIEINTADTLDLMQLKGIGRVYANRIVKYRDLLGGFHSKEQLLEVYGLQQELYQTICPYISIDTANIKTININTADIDQLKKHPYLDYYQAKAILRYRQLGNTFGTVTDLQNVTLIDNNTFEKIKPYLSVQ